MNFASHTAWAEKCCGCPETTELATAQSLAHDHDGQRNAKKTDDKVITLSCGDRTAADAGDAAVLTADADADNDDRGGGGCPFDLRLVMLFAEADAVCALRADSERSAADRARGADADLLDTSFGPLVTLWAPSFLF